MPFIRQRLFSAGCFVKKQGVRMKKNRTRVMTAALLSFLIILFTAFAPAAPAGLCEVMDEMPKLVEYTEPENYFKCRLPAGWTPYDRVFGLSAEEKKVFGITLLGPDQGSPVTPALTAHYYAPGNLLHDNMDVFIGRHASPALGYAIAGKSYGEVQNIEAAGRKAKAFERIDIRFTGERLNAAKISIFEKYVVVPALQNDGFYVLKLSVPATKKDKFTGMFEEVVKSFTPEK